MFDSQIFTVVKVVGSFGMFYFVHPHSTPTHPHQRRPPRCAMIVAGSTISKSAAVRRETKLDDTPATTTRSPGHT